MARIRRGPFQVLGSREVYKNPWIRVREDQVLRPGGTHGLFGVIEMKAGASVLAVAETHEVFLVKEYKYGIDRDSIETMSGALEQDETPLDAAQRELKEELGLVAQNWIDLGRVDPFTTIVYSPNYIFLALDLSEVGNSPDEGEMLHSVKVPLDEAVAMVMRGEITHAASCVLILKASAYLKELG